LDRYDLDLALNYINQAIASGVSLANEHTRRARPWFDSSCYVFKQMLLQALIFARLCPIMRPWYNGLRSSYKALLRSKRALYYERQERLMIECAEKEPFRFLRTDRKRTSCPITLDVWRRHFLDIFFSSDVDIDTLSPALCLVDDSNQSLNRAISELEVSKAICSMANNKAAGPDRIAYEHLKFSVSVFIGIWTRLYNLCLFTCTVPDAWRHSILSVLYKPTSRKVRYCHLTHTEEL